MAECDEKRFLHDVREHQMEVIRDDGVHRHIRFRKPGTMCMHFDLITWPGYLCYAGDMGTYVFSRLTDMFEFFRTDREHFRPRDGRTLAINEGYWSEKLQAVDGGRSNGSVTEFDPERFKQVINEYRVRWMRDMREGGLHTKEQRRELWEAVDEEVLYYLDDGEHRVFDKANDFEHAGFQFTDLWDHRFTRYTFRFLWCCYALAWAIARYDEAKAARGVMEARHQTFSQDPPST